MRLYRTVSQASDDPQPSRSKENEITPTNQDQSEFIILVFKCFLPSTIQLSNLSSSLISHYSSTRFLNYSQTVFYRTLKNAVFILNFGCFFSILLHPPCELKFYPNITKIQLNFFSLIFCDHST